MKYCVTLSIALIISIYSCFAIETSKTDSLKLLLNTTSADTPRIDLLIDLSILYVNTDSSSTFKYLSEARRINSKINSTYKQGLQYYLIAYTYYKNLNHNSAIQNINKGIVASLQEKDSSRTALLFNLKGSVFADLGSYDSSLTSFMKGLNIFISLNNKVQTAEGYRKIGEMKWLQGDYALASEYTEKAIPLYDSIGYETGKAWAFNTLAILCFEQELYDQALRYYNSAYNILLKNNEFFGLSAITLNKGEIYWKRKDYEKALELYNTSLELSLKYNIQANVAYCYTNIGIVHHEMGNYHLAKENYDKAMQIWEAINDKTGLIYCLNYIAILKLDQGYSNSSINYANRALKISKQIGSKDESRRAYETLSKAYSIIGEYKKAYESHVLFKLLNDSIFDGKAKNRLLSIESRNKLEKQKQQLQIQTIELKLKDSKIKQQATQRNALIGGLGLVTTVIFLIAFAYVQKKKANVEITKQKNEIEKQKNQIETIHEELTSSIRYASRIQGAVLPAPNQMAELLGDHFILFKPKDIVSGDFYWVTRVKTHPRPFPKGREEENRIYGYNTADPMLYKLLKDKADEMRNKPTEAESILWKLIKTNQIGYHFRRQHIIERYIADFVCLKKRLIVEVDGKIHDYTTEEDAYRTSVLNQKGYRVIRFNNEDVILHPDKVVSKIKEELLKEPIAIHGKEKGLPLSEDSRGFSKVLPLGEDLGGAELLIFCVADCTGHGVPGAFMSMLGVSFLNDIVHKENVTSAAEVLNHLRDSVIAALKQRGEGGEQKDGMDMGLCVIDTGTKRMQFAGGYNPCWIIPNSEFPSPRIQGENEEEEMEVIQLKPDKMPIAIHKHMEPYTNHEVQLFPGDQIYLMSDGFQDQFGGPQGKKFMVKNLRELVVANSKLPMVQQCEALEKTLEEWKSSAEQVDDVTIMGIKM